MLRAAFLPLCLALTACVPAATTDFPSRAAVARTELPPMKVFATPNPVAPARSNRDIARDFLDLSFQLESGRALPVFTRIEGPITLRVTGAPPATLTADLERLLQRLRREARIDIREVRGNDATITIQAVTQREIRRYLPQAACFVVPNVSSLAEYRRARRSAQVNWTLLTERKRLSIFVPNDVSPQEVRDCLHEELAQALGPLNDLYRLSDSVFNDDNIHTVLTGFDMLILRATYDPALATGMDRQEVAARLPAILARINPRGEGRPSLQRSATPRSWIEAVQDALGPGTAPFARQEAATRALQIAKSQGWQDHRLAFSHYALGRISQGLEPRLAMDQFQAAATFYRISPDTGLHQAYVATQLAAYAVNAGDGQTALRIIAPAKRAAMQYENAALLATLMMLRAEALDLLGRASEASAVRMDSLGWARYGFGADWAVRAKLGEIAALSPLKSGRG